jgi:hypothetical protein
MAVTLFLAMAVGAGISLRGNTASTCTGNAAGGCVNIGASCITPTGYPATCQQAWVMSCQTYREDCRIIDLGCMCM